MLVFIQRTVRIEPSQSGIHTMSKLIRTLDLRYIDTRSEGYVDKRNYRKHRLKIQRRVRESQKKELWSLRKIRVGGSEVIIDKACFTSLPRAYYLESSQRDLTTNCRRHETISVNSDRSRLGNGETEQDITVPLVNHVDNGPGRTWYCSSRWRCWSCSRFLPGDPYNRALYGSSQFYLSLI